MHAIPGSLPWLRSVSYVLQAANESPSSAEFADRQHQFVVALLQGKINGVVFRVHDTEEPRVAETLGTSAAVENLTIQEDTDVVAITNVELLHLLPIRINGGPRIYHLHSRLGFQTLRKVALKRNYRMRGLAIAIEDHKAGWLCFYILPGHGIALCGRQRTLKIPLQRIVGRRQSPFRQHALWHC